MAATGDVYGARRNHAAKTALLHALENDTGDDIPRNPKKINPTKRLQARVDPDARSGRPVPRWPQSIEHRAGETVDGALMAGNHAPEVRSIHHAQQRAHRTIGTRCTGVGSHLFNAASALPWITLVYGKTVAGVFTSSSSKARSRVTLARMDAAAMAATGHPLSQPLPPGSATLAADCHQQHELRLRLKLVYRRVMASRLACKILRRSISSTLADAIA